MAIKAADRPGRRAQMNVRTTAALRDKLEASAALKGANLTHEVESRLERSFLTDDEFMDRLAKRVVDEMEARDFRHHFPHGSLAPLLRRADEFIT